MRKNRQSVKFMLFFLVALLPITVSLKAQTLNLLPPIPEPTSNPHLATAFNGVKTGNTIYIGDAKDQDETLVAALAYLHPASPYKGQQNVLDRLLVLLNGRFSLWLNNKNLGDHMSSFEVTYAYLALKTFQPDKIPSEKKADWEQAISKHTSFLISNNPNIYNKHLVGALIVNMDIFRTMSVFLGALAVGDNVSADIGRSAVENCLSKSLLGDGGTHYVSYSNESYGYHGSIVYGAAWFYLFTGSIKIKNFLLGMKNYVPLSQHQGGFGDFSTAPPWKSQYVANALRNCAMAMAYITGDGYNYSIGQDAQSILLPFLYRSGLKVKTLPDNFILYDQNILGPRGRFGAWGVVGTTRDPSIPGPEVNEIPSPTMCGVSTFVGAYILDSPAGKLNAALHGVCPEVKYSPGIEKDWSRGSKWAFLSGDQCHNATSKSKSIYGLSASYKIYKRSFAYTENIGWNGNQEWVFTPDRVIGMSEISTDVASTIYGLAQRIALVSFRGSSIPGDGKAQKLISVGTDTWNYGNLRIKVHMKDYNGSIDSVYYAIYGNPNDQGSCIIEMHDAKSGKDVAYSYPAGTKRFTIIEATNNKMNYSTKVVRLELSKGLNGFEFEEQTGRKIRMIHNTTDNTITYSGSIHCPFDKARIVKSWDESTLNALKVIKGDVTISTINIPSYGNIMIINSNISDDHALGYKVYNSVFKK